jgi:hypothetical protein
MRTPILRSKAVVCVCFLTFHLSPALRPSLAGPQENKKKPHPE